MTGQQSVNDGGEDQVHRNVGVDVVPELSARHAALKDRGHRGTAMLQKTGPEFLSQM